MTKRFSFLWLIILFVSCVFGHEAKAQVYLSDIKYTETFNTLSNSYEIKNSDGAVVVSKKFNPLTGGYDIRINGERSFKERVQIQEIEPYVPDWSFLAQAQRNISTLHKTRFDELMNYYQETKYFLSESVYMAICFENVKNRTETLAEIVNSFENDMTIASLFSSDLSNNEVYEMLLDKITNYRNEFINIYSESLVKKKVNEDIFKALVVARDLHFKSAQSTKPISNGDHQVVACLKFPQSPAGTYGVFTSCRVSVRDNMVENIRLDGVNRTSFDFSSPALISRGYYANMTNSGVVLAIFFNEHYAK